MSNKSPDRKKVKTGSSVRSTADAISSSSICDLPDTILSHVATYLAVPSRALFAVALTAPSSSWCRSDSDQQERAVSRAILSSTSWEVLNFGDVEERLAFKMKDEDLHAVLVCIDALSKLKRIKLINCYSIRGDGLNPLRGSVVLEQMDLSLIEQEEEYNCRHKLSVDAVVPILDSIVEKDGCAIRHIDFPKHLNRLHLQNPEEFERFLHRFSRLLAGRQPRCSKCNDICRNPPNPTWITYHSRKWRGQKYTCCKCIKDYCLKPQCRVEICGRCGKSHCKLCTSRCDSCGKSDGCTAKCEEAAIADNCGRKLCAGCVKTCQQCGHSGCEDCLNFHSCPSCGDKGHCGDCYEGESTGGDEIYCDVCGYVQKSDY